MRNIFIYGFWLNQNSLESDAASDINMPPRVNITNKKKIKTTKSPTPIATCINKDCEPAQE